MVKSSLAGRCGIFCGACEFNKAISHPEIKPALSIAINVPEEDIYCKGCGDLDDKSWGHGCKTAKCCDNHLIQYCFDCSEYPCGDLKAMVADPYPHHHSVILDLDRMKEVGINTWLSEQKDRWSCKSCGESFCWYSETCSKCGKKVMSCKEEEMK
jgi:hypothetical protein